MKDVLISWLITFIIIFPIAILIRNGKRKNEVKTETEEAPIPDGVDILRIIRSAYNSLVNQNARGYGPWLTTCIRKMAVGVDVPIETALLALKWTRDELNNINVTHHYDLGEIGRAILALEVELGEWG